MARICVKQNNVVFVVYDAVHEWKVLRFSGRKGDAKRADAQFE